MNTLRQCKNWVWLIAGILTLSSCSSPAQLSESEAENAAQVLLDEASSGGSAAATDDSPEDTSGAELVYLDEVARCMRNDGFEFVAQMEQAVTSDDDSPYGITSSAVAGPSTDPNEQILSGLSPQDEKAYLVALWGDPADESVVGCADSVFDEIVDPAIFESEEEAEVFLDRRIESLRFEVESKAIARSDVIDAVAVAETCVVDKLGEEAQDGPFDFVTHAERRVAAVIDPDAALEGATLFDLMESSDEALEFGPDTIESMLAAEQFVWQTEVECRQGIQDVLDAAFADEASKLLLDSPELGQALLDASELNRG